MVPPASWKQPRQARSFSCRVSLFYQARTYFQNRWQYATRGARGLSNLNRTLRYALRSASRTRRQPRKKNTPCISDLAGVKFLLKKGKGVFLSGFCPPSIRTGGVQMQFGLVFAKLFCGRKDSQKRDWFLGGIRIPAAQEGAGGMRGGLLFIRRLSDILNSVKIWSNLSKILL